MNVIIGYTLEVTVTPSFNSLSDWYSQLMWLFSGAPDNPQDETLVGKHSAELLYSAVRSLMNAIRTEDQDAQQNAAHWTIQVSEPWIISQWTKLHIANGKQVVRTLKKNALLGNLEWRR